MVVLVAIVVLVATMVVLAPHHILVDGSGEIHPSRTVPGRLVPRTAPVLPPGRHTSSEVRRAPRGGRGARREA